MYYRFLHTHSWAVLRLPMRAVEGGEGGEDTHAAMGGDYVAGVLRKALEVIFDIYVIYVIYTSYIRHTRQVCCGRLLKNVTPFSWRRTKRARGR